MHTAGLTDNVDGKKGGGLKKSNKHRMLHIFSKRDVLPEWMRADVLIELKVPQNVVS